MGLIYQFYNLIPILNVEENILLPLSLDNREANPEKLEELIRLLGLNERRNHLPNELSGGSVVSMGGKSNVLSAVKSVGDKDVVIIADGAAFGPEMVSLFKLFPYRTGLRFILPESFEWLILKSGIIRDSKLNEMLSRPYEHIDSRFFFSWERFSHICWSL